jgi:hypothetical protein
MTKLEKSNLEVLKDDVIAKARCIRHWHDTGRNDEGMIVSAEAVHDLWESLHRLDISPASAGVAESDLRAVRLRLAALEGAVKVMYHTDPTRLVKLARSSGLLTRCPNHLDTHVCGDCVTTDFYE